MSMNTYPFDKPALWVDKELAAYLALALDKKNGTVDEKVSDMSIEAFAALLKDDAIPECYADPDLYELFEFLQDMGDPYVPCHLPEFEGSITTLCPDKTEDALDENVDETNILVLIPQKEVGPVGSAYDSEKELLDEFRDYLSDVELPADFDWWKRLAQVSGTYFC